MRKLIKIIAAMGRAALLFGCFAQQSESLPLGTYRFEEKTYLSPLSSEFVPDEGFEETYAFGEESIVIKNPEGGEKEYSITYKSEKLRSDELPKDISGDEIPGISDAKEIYLLAETGGSESYSVYRADGELFILSMKNGQLWSVFKIAAE